MTEAKATLGTCNRIPRITPHERFASCIEWVPIKPVLGTCEIDGCPAWALQHEENELCSNWKPIEAETFVVQPSQWSGLRPSPVEYGSEPGSIKVYFRHVGDQTFASVTLRDDLAKGLLPADSAHRRIVGRGDARRAPSDKYDIATGRRIAMARALTNLACKISASVGFDFNLALLDDGSFLRHDGSTPPR